jgi:hypothetical protein
MKTTITSFFSVLAIAGALHAGETVDKNPAPVAPPPADDSLGFSLTAGWDSSYIYRGVRLGDNLVSAGITAPIKLSDKATLTFTPWFGDIASNHSAGITNYDELDLPVSLTYDFGFAVLGVGYEYYLFPFSHFHTNEPNVTFSKAIGNLNIYGGAYWDVNARGGNPILNVKGNPGWYYETGAAYTIKVAPWLSIVPEGKISFGENYYGVKGWNNAIAKISAPITLSKNASLVPYVAGSWALTGLNDAGGGSYFFGGAAITVTF